MFKRFKKFCYISRSFYLLRAFFKFKVLAGSEHNSIFKYKFKTIVDIGANKGQFSLISRYLCPKAKIISFEPLNAPSLIFKNVFFGEKYVTFHKCAIGSKSEETFINLAKSDDSSSLLPITKLQSKIFPGTNKIGVEKIQIKPLTSFISSANIKHPSLLKIDVQGYEYECLIGSLKLLKDFDYIYCECSFIELYKSQKLVSSIISLLKAHNFELISINNSYKDKYNVNVQGDFFFQKE